ncbi:MAG: trypsin-like peptidase domain-containing protein [Roseibium sp.]|nr:trypsin-like peptidase domain-containing protein [Roseibium sp.]
MQNEKKGIDLFSLSTVPLVLRFNEIVISHATGFFWKNIDKLFLITNWHVISGVDPFTGKNIDQKHGCRPNIIEVLWNSKSVLGNKSPFIINLYDGSDEPVWLIHPELGRKVDIAAIDVECPPDSEPYPINEMPSIDLATYIGMDLFVLGYPLKITNNGFPIWKRASIASEPQLLNYTDYQAMLVDTATREGMSGAPVIQRYYGAVPLVSGGVQIADKGGAATKFIGIYSGRIGANDQLAAQLGLVWPSSLIETIVRTRRLDDLV